MDNGPKVPYAHLNLQRYAHPTSHIAENAIAHMEEIRKQRAALAEKKENERIQALEEIAAKESAGSV